MTTLFEAVDAPLCRIYPVELDMENVFRQRKTIEDHTSMVDLSSPTNLPPLGEFLNCEVRDEASPLHYTLVIISAARGKRPAAVFVC